MNRSVPSHYDALGLSTDSSHAEIRSAYRRLALQHHPDRSKDPSSHAIFLEITAAYEVLSDAEAKRHYDERLAFQARRIQEEVRKQAEAKRTEQVAEQLKAERRATPSGATVAQEILRLQALYGRGRHLEAERLAHAIIQIDPKQAVPYAVLADIARGRGQINEASTMYAYAAQMEPSNPVYQRRYEQLLSSSRFVSGSRSTRLAAPERKIGAPSVAAGFSALACIYVAVGTEPSAFDRIPVIHSWTLGLVVALFLSGVSIGAGLAVGGLLDRIEMMTSSSSGRAGSTIILGIVALVNFWIAAILYVFIALGLKAFNYSTSRLMLSTAAIVLLSTFASLLSPHVQPGETFLWGGNLVYLGGLIGWTATDSMRQA